MSALLGALAVMAAGALAMPAGATTACSADNSFCIDYSLTVNNAGTANPATHAAAPVDASLTLHNTSTNHATDSTVWLDHLDVHLLSGLGGDVVTPSSKLDNNLLIAGSDTPCGSGGDFSSCSGGSGTVYAQVTGTDVYSGLNNIYPGSVGVEKVWNVNPPATGFAMDWHIQLNVCIDPGFPVCQDETFEVQANPNGGGTFTVPATAPFSHTDSGGSINGTAAIDSATINLSGIATKVSTGSADADAPSGPQTVFHLPTKCGTANASATAVDHNAATATVSLSKTVSGCPTARLTSTQRLRTAHFNGSTSTTPLSGRTIAKWRWSFGDGKSKVTTGPKVAHTYSSSRDRMVRLVVQDSLGALSKARTFLLKGSAMSFAASHSKVPSGTAVRLSGRLTRWNTTTGLAGRNVRIDRCRAGTCHKLTTLTTSKKAGHHGEFRLTIHPTRTYTYRATFFGGHGFLGVRKSRQVSVT